MSLSHPLAPLHTVALVVVRDNRLLLAFSANQQAWYLPGGKVEFGEAPLAALQREINEELNLVLDPTRLQFLCHALSPAHGQAPGRMMAQDCFLYDLGAQQPSAGAEIGALRFFSYAAYQQQAEPVAGVQQMFARLRQQGLIAD